MAEFIEELRERLLPEYEQMRHLNICTDDQIRETMRKRDHFLNRIFQTPKSVADYVDFIRHEKLIHKWVGEKEKSLNKNMSELKHSIVGRIIRLYREGLRHFPEEIRLWENFILFSKKSMPNEVNGIYNRMLAFHGDKSSVWSENVLWVYENGTDINKINDIFFRALQRHPESECLNITFFDILLKESTKMSPVKEAEALHSEQQLGLDKALLVYRNSRAKISNSSYYVKLLGRCEEELYVDTTVHIQKEIIDDMITNFPHDESVWNCLAQRELNGLSMIELLKHMKEKKGKPSLLEQFMRNNTALTMNNSVSSTVAGDDCDDIMYSAAQSTTSPSCAQSWTSNATSSVTSSPTTSTQMPSQSIQFEGKRELPDDEGDEDFKEHKYALHNDNESSEKSIWRKRTLRKRIELCVHIYQMGLRALQTPEICSYYINAMLQLNRNLTNQANLKRRCLAAAFREGHISKLMNEQHYFTCVKLLLKDRLVGVKNATQMLMEATHLKESVIFFEMWMAIHMANDNREELMNVFHRANKLLGVGNCSILWRKILNFLKCRTEQHDDNMLSYIEFFKEAAMQFSHEFDCFRTEYLEYLTTTQSISSTRKEYDAMCLLPPPCLSLHRKMIEIETMSMIDLTETRNRLRKCYENAALQFGKTNTNVWIDYIKFERDFGEPKRMTLIFEKAKDCLTAEYVDDFIAEFTLLKAIV